MSHRLLGVRCLALAVVVSWMSLAKPEASYAALKISDLADAAEMQTNRLEGVSRLLDVLHDEVVDPTVAYKVDVGSYIDHDYLLAQVTIAFRNLLLSLTTPPPIRPSKEEIARLKAALGKEKNREARDVLNIVLVYCGATEDSEALTPIIRGNGSVDLRELAIGATWSGGDVPAIPELLECLDDPIEAQRKDYSKGGYKKFFPLREAAAFGLRKLGVSLEDAEGGRYRVDQESAIRVLEKALDEASDRKAVRLLDGIRRVGGVHARKALAGFITANAAKSGKEALVARARVLRSQLYAR